MPAVPPSYRKDSETIDSCATSKPQPSSNAHPCTTTVQFFPVSDMTPYDLSSLTPTITPMSSHPLPSFETHASRQQHTHNSDGGTTNENENASPRLPSIVCSDGTHPVNESAALPTDLCNSRDTVSVTTNNAVDLSQSDHDVRVITTDLSPNTGPFPDRTRNTVAGPPSKLDTGARGNHRTVEEQLVEFGGPSKDLGVSAPLASSDKILKPANSRVSSGSLEPSALETLKAEDALKEGGPPIKERVISKRRFVCSVPGCEKAFGKRFNLREHMRVHTGDEPFVCSYPLCGKKFKWKSSLSFHESLHLSAPDDLEPQLSTFTHAPAIASSSFNPAIVGARTTDPSNNPVPVDDSLHVAAKVTGTSCARPESES